MPSVQVLPQVPSFGQNLAQSLAAASEPIAAGLQKRFELAAEQGAYGVLRDPNASAVDRAIAFGRLRGDTKKSAGPVWAAVLGPQSELESGQRGAAAIQNRGAPATQPVNPQTNPVTPSQAPTNPLPNIANPGGTQQPQEAQPRALTQQQVIQQTARQQPLPKTAINPNTPQDAENQRIEQLDLQHFTMDQLAEAAGLPGPYGKAAERLLKLKEKELERLDKRELQTWKSNEPELIKLNEKITTDNNSRSDFDRLDRLNQSGKLPPGWATALFTHEGDLRPVAAANLSPEAQEFVKIVQNQLKGIKGTLGAQISGFEVIQYLKTFPGLLNSPEGRTQILRNLRLANEANSIYDNQILKEFENAGGSYKISYSEAASRARKATEKEVSRLKKEITTGAQINHEDLPPAAAYSGQPIRNKETGEIFVSDGKNWIPQAPQQNQGSP